MITKEIEINKYHPCGDAMKFRLQYPDFQSAWDNCPRGDWMLWIAQKVGVDLQTLTLAKALCANTVRGLITSKVSIKAIDIALLFGHDKATRTELAAAADAAADAAAYAADAAAYAAAYAADAAYDADAAAENQKETADICRQILTEQVLYLINKK